MGFLSSNLVPPRTRTKNPTLYPPLIGLQPGRDACARSGACADVSRAFIKKKVRMHVIKIFLAAVYDGVRGEQ